MQSTETEHSVNTRASTSGVEVTLFQKGSCSSYGGITALSLHGDSESEVLSVEPRIEDMQFGFHLGSRRAQQIFTLSRVLEGLWDFTQTVHICFVVLKKAQERTPEVYCRDDL